MAVSVGVGVSVGDDGGGVALLLGGVDGVREADLVGVGRVADEDGAGLDVRVVLDGVGVGVGDGVFDDGLAECVAGGTPPEVPASVDVGRTTK